MNKCLKIKSKLMVSLLFLTICQGSHNSCLLAAPHLQQSPQGPELTPKRQIYGMVQGLQSLKGPVPLPDLPMFTGETRFITGQYVSTPTGTAVYRMMFFAQEEPEVVINFYKNTLNMRQWKIVKSSPNSLSAEHKNGHTCTITINEADPAEGKSMLAINYQQAGLRQSQR